MTDINRMQIEKDLANKTIKVTRFFDASPDMVWRAWTESELLDQWWAPKPYRAETKTMDFRVGGRWLYAMVGPDDSRQYCRVDFVSIDPGRSFTSSDAFCNADGSITNELPAMTWHNEFVPLGERTKVLVTLQFKSVEDLEKIVEMGFEEGFTMALTNLDQYISTQFRLRKEAKTSNKPRVSVYLNFPGNTEEAFTFYQKVFNGEFSGGGLRRFGDIDLPADAPPLSEADKNLIIHAELTIMNGYVLMATDAPESMGFNLTEGNNMHINLEPDSREETERLFRELSEGGEVTMPLQDMFWGAYFGSFKDKYGINWMLNFQTI